MKHFWTLGFVSLLILPLLSLSQSVARTDSGDSDAEDIVAIEQVQTHYQFAIDSHDGEGVANLFTSDGVFDVFHNNGDGTISPITSGLCVNTGRDQIQDFIQDVYKTTTPLAFPAHSHHFITGQVVEVHGDSATLKANLVAASIATTGGPLDGVTGEYDNILRRTPDGWKYVRNRVLVDQSPFSLPCGPSGPIPPEL
jgi:ketosteroid isomerase-like protein